jgi:hypothetical protein
MHKHADTVQDIYYKPARRACSTCRPGCP